MPDVNSSSPKLSDFSDEQHIYYTIEGEVTDNGGKTPTEAGAVFSTSSNPTLEVGIEFNGAARDLGYYESDGGASVGSLYIASGADNRLHAAASRSGLLMITVEGDSDNDLHHLETYDIVGNRLG